MPMSGKGLADDPLELPDEAFDAINGGLKWVSGTQNDDVIDARGGQGTFLGFAYTLDINGKVSSITPPK